MPPNSKEKQLRHKLAEYLSNNTDISDWKYFSDEHSSQVEPVGNIYIANTKPISQFNYDYLAKNFTFQIRILVSKTDTIDLIDELYDWQAYLTNEIMRSLSKTGYEGYFQGINWVSAQIFPQINQDNGGTGALLLIYTWDDDATTSGEQYGKFL